MNPYQESIESFFSRIIELRHISSHLGSTLDESVKRIESSVNAKFISGSYLVISDWTGPSEDGWEINYSTDFSKLTFKENYNDQVKRIFSEQCCYTLAQSFEALEKYFKDCVFERMKQNHQFQEFIESNYPKNYSRATLPGGDEIFKLIKKAVGPQFNVASKLNEHKIRFKEFWDILSEIRHSITHSRSIIRLSKIKKSEYHKKTFTSFLGFSDYTQESFLIELDNKRLDKLLKNISEFGFQVFKLLSINENLNWQHILKE